MSRVQTAALIRLGRAPDADAFVLRGGARIRRWVPRRPANDLDLVVRMPYDPRGIEAHLRAALARAAPDGVRFDPERVRIAHGWHPETPGVLVEAWGAADRGAEQRVRLDLRFALPLGPEPEPERVGGCRVWQARPETLIARKLRVLAEHGRAGWRCKDLADVALLATRAPPDPARFELALRAAFGDAPRAEAREMLTHPAWWAGAAMAGRWARFAAGAPHDVPDTLDAAVGAVRGLAAALGGAL